MFSRKEHVAMKVPRVLVILCSVTVVANSWSLATNKFGHSPEPGVPTVRFLYAQYCLHCHGAALDGKGPDAATLQVSPTNFHTYLSRLKGDAELRTTIKEGRRYLGMHTWEETFTDDQIQGLILYIRSVVQPVA
jgi:mono/diheme cytochrome c family protein